MTSEALGVKVEITCNTGTGTGWIENPIGGGPGIGLGTGSASNCTVNKPAGCTVAEPITATTKTELTELGGSFWGVATPDEGSTFVEIELKNCGLLNQKFKITGKTAGKINNETGTVRLNEEMNELKFAGNKAGFEGEAFGLTDGGGTGKVLLSVD